MGARIGRRSGLGAGFLGGVAVSLAIAATASAATRITGVTWTGSASSPTVTISGHGFGSNPPAKYALPTPQCNSKLTGRDYGKYLWFEDDTVPWDAGHGHGNAMSSCVGLLIRSWSANSIKLNFGSGYGTFGWTATSGDNFVWTVHGYVWGGVINYGG